MGNRIKKYSLDVGIQPALSHLRHATNGVIPYVAKGYLNTVIHGDNTDPPCALKHTKAISAQTLVEVGLVAHIADLRHGHEETRTVSINVERARCSFFAAYLSTLDGMCKRDLKVSSKVRGESHVLGTCVYGLQSI